MNKSPGRSSGGEQRPGVTVGQPTSSHMNRGSPAALLRVRTHPAQSGTQTGEDDSSSSTPLCIRLIVWAGARAVACPGGSAVKNPPANAGDSNLICGSGRSPGEGTGYLLQYSWASLVAQLVKNPPAMEESWVQSLGWEHPLEKRKATHSSILAWRIPWTV